MLRVRAEAEVALWYDASFDADLVDFAQRGAPGLPARLAPYVGSQLPAGAATTRADEVRARRRGRWTVADAPKPLRIGFRTIEDDFERIEEFSAFPIWRDFYAPLGLRDHVRVLAYRGNRFLGWVGAFSTTGTFRRGVGRRLSSELRRTIEGLAVARTLEALDDDAFLVFDGAGVVERGTERALAWLSRERAELFGRCVRAADHGEGAQFRIDGVSARLVRLAGGESVRYLAMLRDRDSIELCTGAGLSPMEQAVAEDLAAGLTIREIAASRGRAESTVKSQAKNIYRKLAVASRVELVEALRGETP